MEGTFQVCGNCKRSVPSSHFTLHEAHCLRFREVKEHCMNPQAEEHQERPAECKFCEVAMSLSKLELHEQHCGGRMGLCPDCNQPVKLHALAQHKDVCQGEQAQLGEGKLYRPERTEEASRARVFPDGMPATVALNRTDDKGKKNLDSEKEIYCYYCNQMIPGNKYFYHMKKCPTSEFVNDFPPGKPKTPSPSFPSQAAKNQTSTAEKDVRPKTKNMNRFPLLYENSTKQAPRGKNKAKNLPSKSEFNPWARSPTEDETAYNILRGCFQCGILLPLPTLIQHQEKCQRLASSKAKQVKNLS